MSDQLVAYAATYTTNTRDKYSVFETAISEIKRLQTYALERTASGVS